MKLYDMLLYIARTFYDGIMIYEKVVVLLATLVSMFDSLSKESVYITWVHWSNLVEQDLVC